MVFWHGRPCKAVRGKILRTGEQNNSTAAQSRYTIHWRPSIQRRRKWVSWRIFYSLLTNCSQMSVSGSYWETWHIMVCEQTGSCGHKVDESLWQTLGAFDLIHSSHAWIQAILLCGETLPNNADWDCFKTPILQEFLRIRNPHLEEHCAFLGSHTFCSKKLDVQETDISLTQFYGSWTYFSGCRFTHGRNSRACSLGLSTWSISFSTKPKQQFQRSGVTGNLSRNTTLHMKNQNPTKAHQSGTGVMLITFRLTWDLLN